MRRFWFLSILFLGAIAVPALADPVPGEDVAACHVRDGDAQTRLDACERVISDGKSAPKDLALAYAIRGDGLFKKRNLDKAVEAYSKAIELDPDAPGFYNARGWSYESMGKDDQAIADYNVALQKRRNFALAYNNRGTVFLRRGALQSALDDFNAALKYNDKLYYAHQNRGRVSMLEAYFEMKLGVLRSLLDDGMRPRLYAPSESTYPLRRCDLLSADRGGTRGAGDDAVHAQFGTRLRRDSASLA